MRWQYGATGLFLGLSFVSISAVVPTRAHAQACSAPVEGDLGCLGTSSGRVENADGNDVTGSCGGGITLGHPDNVFTFTCSGAGTVAISMTGMDCDLDLFVLGPGDCTVSPSCYARSTNGLTPVAAGAMVIDESLTFACTPNETYYVVVDAFGQSGQTDCDSCGLPCVFGGCAGAYPPTSNAGVINCDDSLMEGDYAITVTSGGAFGCGEQCTDGVDNNANGAIDCADAGCATAPACAACTGCLIGGTCFADGAANPSSACEVCDASASADAWALAVDGTSCGAAAGACDGADVCAAGACVPGAARSCDDDDVCTTDSCTEPTGCLSTPIAGCCADAADCDDGMACTEDTCDLSTHRCRAEAVGVCCTADGECDDGNECTVDSCNEFGVCATVADTSCCEIDCDDENMCTTDSCLVDRVTCVNAPIAGCCASDGDCSADMRCLAGRCASRPRGDASLAFDGSFGPAAEETGGCGCRSTGGGGTEGPAVAVLLLIAGVLVRRRRRGRR